MSTPPEDRGRIFGLSYAAQQVGSVIGPLVGGGMAMYLPLKSVIFLGGFILLPLAFFLWYMRPKNEESSHGSPARPFARAGMLMRMPAPRPAALAGMPHAGMRF